MANLTDLLAQRNALDQQIEKTQREERQKALAQIKTLMSEYGINVADLSARVAKKTRAGAKVAAKYRNKASGESWSGRGLQPRWLKAALATGKKLGDFAV
ncbi:MAG: H-NS histone family protein [Burkholderiaceae bacterium]|nr:H-NS histone family protein [Burkholderiaceae bacterium]